jgi:hypothetical protein
MDTLELVVYILELSTNTWLQEGLVWSDMKVMDQAQPLARLARRSTLIGPRVPSRPSALESSDAVACELR